MAEHLEIFFRINVSLCNLNYIIYIDIRYFQMLLCHMTNAYLGGISGPNLRIKKKFIENPNQLTDTSILTLFIFISFAIY